MTIAELIEELQNYPQDTRVVVRRDGVWEVYNGDYDDCD